MVSCLCMRTITREPLFFSNVAINLCLIAKRNRFFKRGWSAAMMKNSQNIVEMSNFNLSPFQQNGAHKVDDQSFTPLRSHPIFTAGSEYSLPGPIG